MQTVDASFAPWDHQWDAITATLACSVTWLCGGLGSGKTHALVWWVWLMATAWAPDCDGLLFQPDFSTFEDVFLTVFRAQIPGEGVLWHLHKSKSAGLQLKIHPRKGKSVTVFVRSASNSQNVMRSEGLTTIGWTALDEPARMLRGQKAFTNSVGRSRVPMKGWKHNPIFIVGSPLGLNHWTARAMGCKQDHPDYGYSTGYEPDPYGHPGYFIRVCRTSDNASNLSEGYERRSRIAFGEALAEQEFNASLMASTGMVLPEWDERRIVIPDNISDSLWTLRVKSKQGSADWGHGTAAAQMTGWTGDRELVAPDGYYGHGETTLQQGVAMHGLEQMWADGRSLPWYGDPSGAGSIDLLRKGFEHKGKRYRLDCKPAKGGPGSWQPGIDLLRNLMSIRRDAEHPAYPVGHEFHGLGAPKLFIAARNRSLIDEIPAYRYKAVTDGCAPCEEPEDGSKDHAIDCLRYAAYTTALRTEQKTSWANL